MAHRELQGRLQIAEEQARMYRDAMSFLMAPGPPQRKSGSFSKSTDSVASAGDLDGSSSDRHLGGASVDRPAERSAVRAILQKAEAADLEVSDSCSGLSDSEHGTASMTGASSFSDATTIASSASSKTTPAGVQQHMWGLMENSRKWIVRDGGKNGDKTLKATAKEWQQLTEELENVKNRRAVVASEREMVAERTAELARCRNELLSRGMQLGAVRADIFEARESCRGRKALYSEQLVSAMNMGALNDSFHIWHRGPFATINGFRVGRLPTHLVDWQEVNAGVGQAALVLVTVAMAMGVEFSKYLIAPCGSFTKIARSEDGRVLYSLHTDESFSLFPRRNFNLALKAFLHCLGEVGEHVQEHDPTLRLPYRIKEKEGTIGGLPVSLGSSLEDWTRALKYMITDLKWITAWAAKYLPPC